MRRVLVVDDEPGVRESLRMLLKGDCDVVVAEDVTQALHELAAAPVDLVLLDLVMPGASGLDLLAELEARGNAPPVVVLSATRTVATAVEAMKRGAVDYVTKPFEVDALRLKVRRLLAQRDLETRAAALEDELAERDRLDELLGRSGAMRGLFRAIERVAASPANVLVVGESGTGKELVARALHRLGPLAGGPFVAVSSGAIPANLIESELFGHERGAFTGARERRIGRFEAAQGGTLFLDEIGELAPETQVKLLRALQERVIERVGGNLPIAVDARIVAATHRDLAREVAAGRFREDLYYRLCVVPLEVPPLRERREDVGLLAAAFLTRARETAGRGPGGFEREALAALERYPWPGNVRELENAVQRAVALCEGGSIGVEDLPPAILDASRTEALRDAVRQGQRGMEDAVACFERDLIREALDRCAGNQTRAAERLGITRRLLKLKMDRYALAPSAAAPGSGPGSGSRTPGSPRGVAPSV